MIRLVREAVDKSETIYLVECKLEVDINISSSYDGDLDNDMFDDEISDMKSSTSKMLFDKISKSIENSKKNILQELGVSRFEIEFSDIDDDIMYCYITTDKEVSSDAIVHAIDKYFSGSETESTDSEFSGDFLGYEHGYNLPDSGGPPIYSDETANIEVTTGIYDTIKVSLYED